MIATAKVRFFTRVALPDENGCCLWLGPLTSNGYGRISADGRMMGAHRFAYEYLVGPIPRGLVIDHLCRVRHCVAPDHLEPVTDEENQLRGHRYRQAHPIRVRARPNKADIRVALQQAVDRMDRQGVAYAEIVRQVMAGYRVSESTAKRRIRDSREARSAA